MQTGIIEVIKLFIKLMENSGVKKNKETKEVKFKSVSWCACMGVWVGHNMQLLFPDWDW